MKTLREATFLNLKNKRVLLRVDFNVPIKDNEIQDDTRIKNSIPTICYLKDKGARIILCSHIMSSGKAVSLELAAKHLSQIIQIPVKFLHSCVGDETENFISSMLPGDILLLENLRILPSEEENDELLSQKMASIADIYVNDAFSVSHRNHASIVGVPKYLPSYAGLSLQDTLLRLDRYIKNPTTPVMAIIGGAKISDKLGLLSSLIKNVNVLCIGGAMANTFLLSKGVQIGFSIHEPNLVETADNIIKSADQYGCKLILPRDVVLIDERVVPITTIGKNDTIMDIGQLSIEEILKHAKQSKTIWWNGPLGKFEVSPFDLGTKCIATSLAEIARNSGTTVIVGGGDTIHAVKKSGVNFDDYTYVSTAGGAFLEFIKDSTLPGIEALETNSSSIDLQYRVAKTN